MMIDDGQILQVIGRIFACNVLIILIICSLDIMNLSEINLVAIVPVEFVVILCFMWAFPNWIIIRTLSGYHALSE
jgi:hypothetical protein